MFKFILNNKVNETKNEYSAWEPITPFRLYETGFDILTQSFCVVLCRRSVLYIGSKVSVAKQSIHTVYCYSFLWQCAHKLNTTSSVRRHLSCIGDFRGAECSFKVCVCGHLFCFELDLEPHRSIQFWILTEPLNNQLSQMPQTPFIQGSYIRPQTAPEEIQSLGLKMVCSCGLKSQPSSERERKCLSGTSITWPCLSIISSVVCRTLRRVNTAWMPGLVLKSK